jgi:hypothetical protein
VRSPSRRPECWAMWSGGIARLSATRPVTGHEGEEEKRCPGDAASSGSKSSRQFWPKKPMISVRSFLFWPNYYRSRSATGIRRSISLRRSARRRRFTPYWRARGTGGAETGVDGVGGRFETQVKREFDRCSPITFTSNGRRVSVHWFAGVLQSLCSSS